MSAPNPFDQFADDFRAAIPGAPPKSSEPVLTMGPPAPAPAPKPSGPPMNAPPPMANAGMYGMYGGPPPPGQMGQPPPPMGGGFVGQPPPPMGGGFMGQPPPPPGGMNGAGGPPPLNNGMGMNMGMAMVPSAQPSNPYANALGGPPPPMGMAPPPPMGQPPVWGSQPVPPQQQQPPPQQMPPPPAGAPTMNQGPPPPQQQQPPPPPPTESPAAPTPSEPVLQPPPPAPTPTQQPPPQDGGFGGLFDPMGPPASGPAPVPPAADPWGPSLGAAPPAAPPVPTPTPAAPPTDAMVPAPNSDPFGGIFGPSTAAPPAPTPGPPAAAPPPTMAPPNNDPWGDMGFGTPPAPPNNVQPPPPAPYREDDNSTLGGGTISDMRNAVPTTVSPEADFFSSGPSNIQAAPTAPVEEAPKKPELPEGGEYFDARIFTPTLGVMFFKPQELTDSLFLNTDRSIVDGLGERPTVAFIVEGSSARSAGVELGNVLLKVNGIDVRNPKEASRLIKEGPRPLPLLFYVPNTTVVVAEGEHMVKYDTRETGAPLSAKDWKPKYVVIGGIIAQPWMMNMYRSKAEYDIAVIETQARRPVSVKVKQFSLQGARIQNDWQGPQMVKYKNKLHPWKFIVILPVSRNPIKISSSNLSQLKPVHEGIRRVLMAQQRGSTPGVQGPTAAPVGVNPYENGGGVSGRVSATEGGIGSARRKTAF